MQYMIHDEFGIHPMPSNCIKEAEELGWKVIDMVEHLASKNAGDTISAHEKKRGRPKKSDTQSKE